MQSSGRRQLSAPKGTAFTGTGVMAASTSATVYANANTTLTANAAKAATSIAVAERRGIQASQSLIVGFGADSQEVVTVDGGYSPATGAGSVTVSALKKAHLDNETVVEQLSNTPVMPGTVVVKSGSDVAGVDDGAGNLVASGVADPISTGTIDYTSGAVSVTFGGSSSRTMTYNGDKFSDQGAIDSLDGSGFYRNFQVLQYTRFDAPDNVALKNLGTTTVSWLVEKSLNGGKSFKSAGKSGTLSSLAKAVSMLNSGAGTDMVRIRAGAASTGSSSVLEVDTYSDISDNGQ